MAIAVFALSMLAVAVWAHFQIQYFRAQWLNVDFEALMRHATMFKQKYTESTFWFDIHYLVFGFGLVEVGLLVFNTVWKVKLMKGEKALVQGGRS